jgi:ABC-type lipoprotein export system ATPase subunit/GNAT superfamily N-acetyltransferase
MIHARVTPRRYDKTRGCYVYDIAFKTKAPISPRTSKVAESFGIGLNQEHEQVLYEDYQLKIDEGDLIYITGDSGSGKSVLLEAIKTDLGEEAISLDQLLEPASQPIIETIGDTYEKALYLLSRVGLNDAILFLKNYSELSEGQRYRYKLAQLLESGKPFWLCDEFLSTLDRTTAKIVAYNIQKQARATGSTLIVATTHTDLEQDLNPDITIRKGWMKEIETIHHNPDPKPCTVRGEITLTEATMEDYHQLSYLHYRGTRVTAPQNLYKLTHKDQTIGIIAYTYPAIRGSGRKKAVRYHPTLKEINQDWALISRVIIHPKYRGIGLGTHIIQATLPMQGRKHVELVAVMAQYHPFAERAGMRLIHIHEPDESIRKAVRNLHNLGIHPAYLGNREYTAEFIQKLDNIYDIYEALLCVKPGPYIRRLTRHKKPYVKRRELYEWFKTQTPKSLSHTLQTLGILNQSKAYLYWSKPTPVTITNPIAG